ncbi:MAG: DUF1801 domain-containing protein [Aquisalinus sp.]|nr:DUF1801 domain-containing protein [Aquisalinus sp.]
MGKSDNKTVATDADVIAFLEAVEPEKRKRDSFRALEMLKRVTGHDPKMWGPSLVGFDEYHYKYESGREGDFLAIGFAPRKANMVFYLMPGYQDFGPQLERLGKHKLGKACLYITDLDKVDMAVLEEMCVTAYQYIVDNYH